MGMRTTAIVRSRIGAIALAVCALVVPANSWAQPDRRTTVRFDDITFDLPGDGWKKLHEGRVPGAQVSQIEFGHNLGGGRGQSLGVWPVIFDSSVQGRTPQEHASAIFNIERFKRRPAGQRWEFGVEVEREVGGRNFPAMDFRVIVPEAVSDGLFLLYFPDDYDARRKFFCFMWTDIHPPNETGTRLEMLDSIVSTVRVRP